MDEVSHIEAAFFALAQPVLRGLVARALTVIPKPSAPGGTSIAAMDWPRSDDGAAIRAWAHSAPQDPVPWMATPSRILALVDGHRPLTMAPSEPWGHAGASPWAPYSAAVSEQVGGLTVFFVNAPHGVRVFAADASRAVELAPLGGVHLFAAWESQGQLWVAGMAMRPQDREGDVLGYGEALLMRWETRPLAPAQRWQGRDIWPVQEAPTLASSWAGVLGVETWLGLLPGATPGVHWLLGALLTRGVHDLPPDLSPFSVLNGPSPDDYGDMVIARCERHAEADAMPPLVLAHRLAGHSLVAVCQSGTRHAEAIVFTLAQAGDFAQRIDKLRICTWDGVHGRLGPPQPWITRGLPAHVGSCLLYDLDVVYQHEFGYAAALTWQPHDQGGALMPPLAGALLHSRDAREWHVASWLHDDR